MQAETAVEEFVIAQDHDRDGFHIRLSLFVDGFTHHAAEGFSLVDIVRHSMNTGNKLTIAVSSLPGVQSFESPVNLDKPATDNPNAGSW